jgi:hypothetical protein
MFLATVKKMMMTMMKPVLSLGGLGAPRQAVQQCPGEQ